MLGLCYNIRHRWEGEMGSSQHKSPPHQARAFGRRLDVVTRGTNDAVYIFSYEYLSETAKIELCSESYIGESAGWTDLTIRLVVRANSMSARRTCPM